MLHGTCRDHLLGYMGCQATENVTDIFSILDSNKDFMTKCNKLENCLLHEQCLDPFMCFMLRKETVKDLVAHTFTNKLLMEQFMMQGLTPFCLQQMDKSSKMSLLLYKESMEQTTQKTMNNNITKKGTKIKITPIRDVMRFLMAIANTHALAKVLFSTTSPHTIRLRELRAIILEGKQTTKLQKIRQYQPNWFAHAMWQLHECCSNFFKKQLSCQDLLEGAQLQNPLAAYNNDMECWIIIK